MRPLATVLALILAATAGADSPPTVKIGPGASLQDLLGKPDSTVVEGADGKKTTVGELKARLKSAPRATGESPDGPGLGTKLKADLATANAAAKAALARVKIPLSNLPRGFVTPVPTQKGFIDPAKNELPCNRVLFNVEGAAVNFQIQPGQLILLNGCFKGAPNAEVRIAGNFPPYGYLLLNILDRGDNYFYGEVPDVSGVPDQSVSITIRFFDGVTTNQRLGFFYAKRQSWEAGADQGLCRAIQWNGLTPYTANMYGTVGCEGSCLIPAVDVWSSKARANGYRIAKFWWAALGPPPLDMRWSDDGTNVLLTTGRNTWYVATRVRIEGPAGLPPF